MSANTTFTLTCSGPGGSASASTTVTVGATGSLPIAHAGFDRAVIGAAPVTLAGSGTPPPGATIVSYAWSQTAGPNVTLSANGPNATFTAPLVTTPTVLTFQLIVTASSGATSLPDAVDILLQPLPPGQTAVNGRVTHARIPTTTTNGLNYAGTFQEPSRGITVELVDAGNGTIIASGTTDGGGYFSFSAPPNTNVRLRARAELVRASGAGARWNIAVRDVDNANSQYTVASGTFSTGATGVTQNLAIQSGWGTAPSSGPLGPRDAAPFAILDTVYRALVKVVNIEPNVNLPPLTIDWSVDNPGGQTFYSSSGTGQRRIVLPGEANVDTEEYDEAIIAHEFGHYIEDVLGRSDSVGGPHALSSRLDPRVAWSEGLATFLAALLLDNSVAIDTAGNMQQQTGLFFDVESFSGAASSRGWWNEASVFVILWDLYDPANDDPAQLGAAPLWRVLTNEMRTTDAFATIFPFVAALKQTAAAAAGAIDAVVQTQPIVASTINAFATTETNDAGAGSDVLPVYTTTQIDGVPRTLRSTNLFGVDNKLGNSRFLRLDVPSPRSIRVQLTASGTNRDPDVYIFRRGNIVASGITPSNEDFTTTLNQAGTYVIEILDCDNAGCSGPNPVPAPTDLTLTLSAVP
ncbi:MAG: hypothetical protein NZM12_03170 [Steroidobacteraceae bacterium]|nr:hypothetical protein [Steroidobacteraceae bacterium]MDW8258335.1 hypothetical protein [Gammaproteobacteria bacterium]